MLLLIVGLILFVLLIVVHEYGHFLVAKRNGVEVEEFGIGFPPKIYGRRLGRGIFEGYYTINLLPLGGFVKLKGENDADKRKGAFGAASTSAKLRIMLAGVVMNLVAALVFFTIVAWVGMPQFVPNQFVIESDAKSIRSDVFVLGEPLDVWRQDFDIANGTTIAAINNERISTQEELNRALEGNINNEVVLEYQNRDGDFAKTGALEPGLGVAFVASGSPAEQIGLKEGDQITAIDGQEIITSNKLSEITKANAGQEVSLIVKQGDNLNNYSVTLLSEAEVSASQGTDNPKGYLGVSSNPSTRYQLIQSTWSAPIVAVGTSAQFTWLTLDAIGGALANLGKALFNLVTLNTTEAKSDAAKAGENVGGPIAIFAILQQGADLGYQFTLFVVAVLSLTLAIMNFLPIPALDGGRAFVMLLFKWLKKPLTPELEDRIHGTGFAALMLLFLVIAIVDFNRFF